jgi:hypothetical protein
MPFEKYPKSKFYNISLSDWSKIACGLRQKYRAGEITGEELIDGVQG